MILVLLDVPKCHGPNVMVLSIYGTKKSPRLFTSLMEKRIDGKNHVFEEITRHLDPCSNRSLLQKVENMSSDDTEAKTGLHQGALIDLVFISFFILEVFQSNILFCLFKSFSRAHEIPGNS